MHVPFLKGFHAVLSFAVGSLEPCDPPPPQESERLLLPTVPLSAAELPQNLFPPSPCRVLLWAEPLQGQVLLSQ